jgi:hypothetical protein
MAPDPGPKQGADRPRMPWARPTPPEPPMPWRTEGVPGQAGPKTSPPPPTQWRRFLGLMLVLLVFNLIISSLALSPTKRSSVSYTFFSTQVTANNVSSITSTSDAIEGTFRKKIGYPAEKASKDQTSVKSFKTQRPSFADDNLFASLQKNGVTVNADNPDAKTPWWESLLAGFGPTSSVGRPRTAAASAGSVVLAAQRLCGETLTPAARAHSENSEWPRNWSGGERQPGRPRPTAQAHCPPPHRSAGNSRWQPGATLRPAHGGNLSSGSSMGRHWLAVDQPNSRFTAQARHLFGPFYRARVLDTATGEYITFPIGRGRRGRTSAILTGRSSVQRSIKYGIQHELRRQ